MEQIRVATQPERIDHFMRTFIPDIILLDMNFKRDAISGQEGFFWLEKIKKIRPGRGGSFYDCLFGYG